MDNLPTGTVTFLFTDIEGSTKLAQEHPEEMPALLARHHELLKKSFQAQNGYVFQILGDGFCAAFHSVNDALNAALEAQRALQSESWTPASVKVRMGIHTGAAQLTDDNQYSGYATLASTQRIMSAGHGGQVLLSGASCELVRDALPTNTELIALGEKRLKDLLRPEHLYQLNISGLTTTFPPLKTLDAFPNNLPVHLTSFVGRENEIAEVKQELNGHRLVTLTGSGGTGKTRLSLQVAADLLEKFDHGVWFVELAPLTDPELIPQTILSTIGIKEQPGKPPLELLKEYLHEKKTLLLLDNCEHLLSASAQVVNTLLRAAPEIKVLASSREALGVRGEASYPVPSLTLPDIKHLPIIEQLSQYEAVRLFIDRALLVSPHFVLGKDNASFIAQICHRLDGIPLAIELAAARMKVLSVDQISKRLDDRFRLLTGGARAALPRQQTLRALIDWSYDLLSDTECLLLRRLSVFAGGWTLEAAEEVCAGDGIHSIDILDLLSQLINKSLVAVVEKSKSGETRYRMLETIRQYAREKLLETGGGESIRNKHLSYFVKLTEQAEPELYRSNQVFWFNKLDDDLDNLRMALEWALATDVESGMRVAAVPWRFWMWRGHFQESGVWLSQFLGRYSPIDKIHSLALAVYSFSLFVTKSNFTETIKIAQQSIQMARAISDRRIEALGLYFLGFPTYFQGNLRESFSLEEQSLAIFRDLGDKIGQANTLEVFTFDHTNLNRAIAFAQESLSIYRELNNLVGIADVLNMLAISTIWNGNYSSPVAWLEEALSISRQIGSQSTEISALTNMGILAYWLGDYQMAIARYEEAILLCEKVGDQFDISWDRVRLAHAYLRQGDNKRAKEMFKVSTQSFLKADDMVGLIYVIEGLASLYTNQNQTERAARLFAWTTAMREKSGHHRPPVEQASVEKDLAVIHSNLNDAEYSKFCTEGQILTTEQAIELAMKEITS